MKRLLIIIFLPLTIASLLIETYTFKYFLYKHYYINTDMLIVASLLLVVFVLYENRSKNNILELVSNLLINTSRFLYLPLLIVYFYLTYLNNINYPNYIFSTYHVQPELILRPIIFSILLSVIIYLKNKKTFVLNLATFVSSKKNRTNNLILGLLILATITLGLNNLFLDFSTLMPYTVAIIKNIHSDKEERYDYMMNMKYGTYYEYLNFVKSVVETKSSILLPPQKNPWQFEGNQRLARYFLYPRTLYSAHEVNQPDKVDYIEIAWGSTDFPPKENDTYGWPKDKIEADMVYIYDFNTNKYQIYNEDYDPEKFLKPGVYGLIKTK